MGIYSPIEITEEIRLNFKPTRLYIKELMGIKYFGKTIRNVETYTGSGKIWKDRIKRYGRQNIKTLWVSDWYISPEEIQEIAIHFSIENKIVESKEWANCRAENGIDGGAGDCSWFATEQSVSKRNLTNLERYGSACAANREGNSNSRKKQKELNSRPEVYIMKRLLRIKRESLHKGWWYNSDGWLKSKIHELEKLPNPIIDTSNYNQSQLTRHHLINRANVQHLMDMKEILELKLGNNWFQRSDEWIDEQIRKFEPEYQHTLLRINFPKMLVGF